MIGTHTKNRTYKYTMPQVKQPRVKAIKQPQVKQPRVKAIKHAFSPPLSFINAEEPC
eukprot:COSAG03_NODE_1674_length_3668_cov_9.833567_6_plen_57_part_00